MMIQLRHSDSFNGGEVRAFYQAVKLKRFLSIHVLLIFLLFLVVYYVAVFIHIEHLLGLSTWPGIFNAFIFTALSFLCLSSFSLCVLTDPGQVPSSYFPDLEDVNHAVSQSHPHSQNLVQICEKCCKYKPPRAHHCRVCRKCILKMDHHCFWINNCVGYRNYKAFIVLIFYTVLGSAHAVVMAIACILVNGSDFFDISSSPKLFYVTTSICYCVVIAVACLTMGSLLGWHIFLISKNMTTIEYREVKKATWLARKQGKSYHHPYNIGATKNISLVMGSKWLKWGFPTSNSYLREGISFPVLRRDCT